MTIAIFFAIVANLVGEEIELVCPCSYVSHLNVSLVRFVSFGGPRLLTDRGLPPACQLRHLASIDRIVHHFPSEEYQHTTVHSISYALRTNTYALG